MVILLNVKNDAYRRIFGAWACSIAKKSFFEILKLQSGPANMGPFSSEMTFISTNVDVQVRLSLLMHIEST